MSSPRHIHDAVFRDLLHRPEIARDFITTHLPPLIREKCDMDTLRVESGSFIDKDLRSHCSDIIYSLKTQTEDAYVHIIIEHQSTPDRQMAFRLMKYAIAAMDRHLKTQKKMSSMLPLVIPILYYHGRKNPYPYPLNWLNHFSDPTLAAQIYSHDFTLVNVTAMEDDEIMQQKKMATLMLLQKHIRQRDLLDLVEKIARSLTFVQTGDQVAEILIKYMMKAGHTRDAQAFINEFTQKMSNKGEKSMATLTLAQQFEKKV